MHFLRIHDKKIQRHIVRYRQVFSILLKYGFAEVLSFKKRLRGFRKLSVKQQKRLDVPLSSLSRWERVRLVLEELGPTFIKFGQIMSSRPDILPVELIHELEKLQSSVTPFPSDKSIEIIESSLGGKIATLFQSFSEEPIASGSIAQVHRAILHNGMSVVIKVRRPDIVRIIETDIEIMLNIVPILEKVFLRSETLNTRDIIGEFGRILHTELDFTNEALHIEQIRENFREDDDIYVPKIVQHYSTECILTIEYIDGVSVSDTEAVIAKGYDRKKLAATCVSLMAKQIFVHGFFHADPHPGNIFILPGHRICFLDFGMIGVLLPRQKAHLGDMIIGLVNQNIRKTTKSLLRISWSKDTHNVDSLEYDVFRLLERYSHVSLKHIDMGKLLSETINLILSYGLRIPPNIFVLSKALVTIEGVARKLYPEFNTIDHIEPFARKIIMDRADPATLGKEFLFSSLEFLEILKDSPDDIQEILSWLKQGKVQIDFDLKGIERILKKGDQLSNRLAYAIVYASLVIGSALVMGSRIPPLWNEIPIIGILGFSTATIVGIWLLFTIIFNK